jgi:hypothetical protein
VSIEATPGQKKKTLYFAPEQERLEAWFKAVEHLSSEHEALTSNCSIAKKKIY